MKAKKYLSQALWLDQMISVKIEQQEKLRAMAEKTTADISRERVSGGIQNSREDVMVRFIDLSHEVNEDIDRLIDLQREIKQTINRLGDTRLKLILEMRYINNRNWEMIARTLLCERRWVMRLHNRALEEIDEILRNSPSEYTQSPKTT